MSLDRRNFLSLLGVGATGAAAGGPLYASPTPESMVPLSAEWDVSWVDRVTGKHRGVFDSPEVSEGAGMFRAILWREQYQEVYGTSVTDMSAVLVLRHAAIAMVMNDAFWARFKLGKEHKIKDPATKKWTMVNPFRVAPEGTPPKWAGYSLEAFMQSGGIILACNLAFGDMVGMIAEAEKVKQDVAREKALAYLIPGIILQPSGVFAAMRAQQAGCDYMIAS